MHLRVEEAARAQAQEWARGAAATAALAAAGAAAAGGRLLSSKQLRGVEDWLHEREIEQLLQELQVDR
jgi:hypothetical protein